MIDVHLDIFEGPLDLLLFLIKKNDLNIQEIKISQITDEYLKYLEIIQELNLEIAGEYLVIASTLIQIKAKSLLPQEEKVEEEEIDLEEELRARLIEYQKYKELSKMLAQKMEEEKGFFYKQKPFVYDQDSTLEISFIDLLTALKDVLNKIPKEIKEIIYDEIPIEEKIRMILTILSEREKITFSELMLLQNTRKAVIVCFLAILELIRLKQILVFQERPFGEILISKYGDGER